ncbi:MAG: hypothetical protein HQL19_08085, partial [Candidatus Omnitrophica bacterium]|nr:hypothetical protein [Candidatus Omnitrophota bacterium]
PIVYSGGMVCAVAALTLPKLLMMLGALTPLAATLPVVAAFSLAGLFGVLAASTFFYMRVARVAKNVAAEGQMYEVRSMTDLFIAMKVMSEKPAFDKKMFIVPGVFLAAAVAGVVALTLTGVVPGLVAGAIGVVCGAVPLAVMIQRTVQAVRLRNMFSYKNFGYRKDMALQLQRELLQELQMKKFDINATQAQKLLSGDMGYDDVGELTHEVAHRLKQFYNKFYRTDIPDMPTGNISPFKRWLEIPRMMLYGTYAGAWDVDWVTARAEIAPLINNDVIQNQFRNYLITELGCSGSQINEILAIVSLGAAYKRLSFETVKAEIDAIRSSGRELTGAEKLLFWLKMDEGLVKYPGNPGDSNDKQYPVIEDRIEKFLKEKFPTDQVFAKELNRVRKTLVNFVAVREDTMININERNRRVFDMLRMYAEDYKWDSLYQSLKATFTPQEMEAIRKAALDMLTATELEDFTAWKEETLERTNAVNYMIQAEINYREMAADKFMYLFQPVNTWTASNPALHQEMAERYKDLPNVGVIEPVGYAGILPLKDVAWMEQRALQTQARVMIAQDLSNRIPLEEAWFLPTALSEYDTDPRLGGQVFPLWSEHALTTPTSGSAGHAEGTWTHPVQMAANQMGTIDVYGKWLMDGDVFFGDSAPSLLEKTAEERAAYKAAGLDNLSGRRGTGPGIRAAEDALQGGGVTAEGGNIRHVAYVEMIQDKTRKLASHVVPEFKYDADVDDLFRGEDAVRQHLSPGAVNKKLTKVALTHFFLRELPGFIGTLAFVAFMAGHVDPWYGMVLKYVAVGFSYMFMHAITLPAIEYYKQLYGNSKGPLVLLKRMFIKPGFTAFFSALAPTYVTAHAYDHLQGLSKFPPTARGGWFIGDDYNGVINNSINTHFKGIVIAAPFAVLMGFLMNFHPITICVSAFYFSMILGWLVAPQFFNPTVAYFLKKQFEKVRYKQDGFSKIGAFALTALDALLFFHYSLAVGWVGVLFGKNKANAFMGAMDKTGNILWGGVSKDELKGKISNDGDKIYDWLMSKGYLDPGLDPAKAWFKLLPLEFSPGDLEISEFRDVLKTGVRPVDTFVLGLIGKPATAADTITISDLERVLNAILKMRDFYKRVLMDINKDRLSLEMQELLRKVSDENWSLTDVECARLNGALLRAVYPIDVWRAMSITEKEAALESKLLTAFPKGAAQALAVLRLPSSQFNAVDLDINVLRKVLGRIVHNQADPLLLVQLNKTEAQANTITPAECAVGLNALLGMRDLYVRVGDDFKVADLARDMRKLLARVIANDTTLEDRDYFQLNKAILKLIYADAVSKGREARVVTTFKSLLKEWKPFFAMDIKKAPMSFRFWRNIAFVAAIGLLWWTIPPVLAAAAGSLLATIGLSWGN